MKNQFLFLATLAWIVVAACNSGQKDESAAPPEDPHATQAAMDGQVNVQDNTSQANVVKIAVGSKDHTTLVKALQAAGLVNSMSNNGPFTVFAPTNAAFDALPKGTLDELMKPEKKDALTNILYHHVQLSTYKTENMQDGQVLTMFDGTPATIHIKDGKYSIGDANIIASIPASNGIVHVIDKVILPPAKNK